MSDDRTIRLEVPFDPTLEGLRSAVSTASLAGVPEDARVIEAEMLFAPPELTFEWEEYA